LNDENLNNSETGTAGSPAVSSNFKLDWETWEVKLAKGRFTHTLRRPTAEMILERDKQIQQEIPIAKDGSYQVPDPTATEDADAVLYDQIKIESTGYTGEIPTRHKSAAIEGIYTRDIAIDPDCDIYGEELVVLEEIGGTADEPDFVVKHILRQPTEAELKKIRSRSAGQMKPGKRGRQTFVTNSDLRSAMTNYAAWLIRIEGTTVNDRETSLALVDPIIQRRVVGVVVDAVNNALLD